jgi:hypothetical protein
MPASYVLHVSLKFIHKRPIQHIGRFIFQTLEEQTKLITTRGLHGQLTEPSR